MGLKGFLLVITVLTVPGWGAESWTWEQLRQELATQNRTIDFPEIPKDENEVRQLGRAALSRAKAALKRILSLKPQERSFANSVEALDSLVFELVKAQYTLDLIGFFHQRTPLAEAARKQEVQLQKWLDLLYLNEAVCRFLLTFNGRKDLDLAQQRTLEKLGEDFVLPPKKVSKIVDSWELAGLEKELAIRNSEYERNISKSRRILRFTAEELEGAHADFLSLIPFDGKYYSIQTADWWQWDHIVRYCTSESTVILVWKAAHGRAEPLNASLVDLLQVARYRKARHWDYSSWVAYQMSSSSVSPAALMVELNKVARQTETAFRREKAEMKRLLGKAPKVWDVYRARQLAIENLGLDDSVLRPYFPLEEVLQGLLRFSERLYGYRIFEVTGLNLWHEQARLFAVQDKASGKIAGAFATDLLARDSKQDWFFSQVLTASKVHQNGLEERPAVLLFTNFRPAKEGEPVLLSFEEVVTLAHELGHVFQDVSNTQPYFTLSGSVEEIVEFPANLLERLAWRPEVLRTFAKHWQTGESLPEELLGKMEAMRTTFGFHDLRKRLATSVLDQKIHSARLRSARKLEQQIFSKLHYPIPADVYLSTTSQHFTDYDGFYWSYLWADALAQVAVDKILPQINDPEIAEGVRFRKEFLESGSLYPAEALIARGVGKRFNFCSALIASVKPEKKPPQTRRTSRK